MLAQAHQQGMPAGQAGLSPGLGSLAHPHPMTMVMPGVSPATAPHQMKPSMTLGLPAGLYPGKSDVAYPPSYGWTPSSEAHESLNGTRDTCTTQPVSQACTQASLSARQTLEVCRCLQHACTAVCFAKGSWKQWMPCQLCVLSILPPQCCCSRWTWHKQ
jgi:hypothetical protein